MHRTFGEKENVSYVDREGAYLIPIRGQMIGVVKTEKGYFLLGGGLDPGESPEQAIMHECLEEAGYTVKIKRKLCTAETYTTHPKLGYFHPIQAYYAGELTEKVSEPTESNHELLWMDYEDAIEKMFAEMKSWAIEQAIRFLK